ncbi:LysR substrate-binding domain-containing protein [Achromobacter xylosoxidans]
MRHSRGVMMTDAGKFLLPQARALLAQASALKQVMRDFSCPPHGRVVMGVPPNVMEGITGIIARRAIQELPDVNLNMVEGLSHTLEEWLDDGRLNLACVFDGSDETTGRPGQVLYEEPFVFVGNADALRPEDGPITLAEALRQPLVVPAAPHRLRALLEDKARELGEQVHVRFEVESGSIMSDLIAQKLGYSILPASVVSSRVQRGELAILLDLPAGLVLYAAAGLAAGRRSVQRDAGRHQARERGRRGSAQVARRRLAARARQIILAWQASRETSGPARGARIKVFLHCRMGRAARRRRHAWRTPVAVRLARHGT